MPRALQIEMEQRAWRGRYVPRQRVGARFASGRTLFHTRRLLCQGHSHPIRVFESATQAEHASHQVSVSIHTLYEREQAKAPAAAWTRR